MYTTAGKIGRITGLDPGNIIKLSMTDFVSINVNF